MTGWRTWALVMALAGLCACSEVSAGSSADSTIVHLGPMPTRPTVAPVVAPSPSVAGSTSPTETPAPTPVPISSTTTTTTTTTVATTTRASAKTACTRVAYIGDSVSLGMTSPETLPDAAARLDAQLAAIGVADLRAEISGGRSIVETLAGQENAHDVAARLRADGFSGCWVIAVGTNDAANIAAGGPRQEAERIASMMSVLGTDPVLWIDAATVTDSGFWAATNMQSWNAGLTADMAGYRNVRVMPWSSFVRPEWYVSDGIHLNAAGAAARVRYIASALAGTFPSRHP